MFHSERAEIRKLVETFYVYDLNGDKVELLMVALTGEYGLNAA